MADPIRVWADRTKLKLKNLNLIAIKQFNTPFEIPIYKQIGAKQAQLIENLQFVPEIITPPPVEAGNVLWSSNTNGQWNQNRKFNVTDKFGDTGPNMKGYYMAASGDPQLEVMGDGHALLKCEPGHGRFYLAACNFNSALELEFNFMNSGVDNLSLKLRSRHQMGGDGPHRFGGFGCAISLTDIDFKTEPYHNTHENSISKDLAEKLSLNTWYKMRYTCTNAVDNKSVLFKAELDYGSGFKTVLVGAHKSPKAYYMDKSLYESHSEAWIRMNNEQPGIIGLRNVNLIQVQQ